MPRKESEFSAKVLRQRPYIIRKLSLKSTYQAQEEALRSDCPHAFKILTRLLI